MIYSIYSMKKIDLHYTDLLGMIKNFLKEGKSEEILKYLESNSNLPGRRGNLELAAAFTKVMLEQKEIHLEKIKELIEKLLEFTNDIAPTNDKREFLAFCGTWTLGALGRHEKFTEFAYHNLKLLAKDPRWRIREAVPNALRILAENDGQKMLNEMNSWIKEGTEWLLLRAIAAGMAECLAFPPLKDDEIFAKEGLNLHEKIFQLIEKSNERNSEEFKALKKGLGYTLSVIVVASPENGFKLMKKLTNQKDRDVTWIIKNNLKKNRLIKNFPKQVNEVSKLLI